jgi:hypothetical protein
LVSLGSVRWWDRRGRFPLPNSPRTKHLPISCSFSWRQAILPELVGLSRFELLTPRLSSVCSNQLSYRPSFPSTLARSTFQDAIQHSAHGILSKNRCTGPIPSKLDRRARHEFPSNQRNGAKPLCQIRVRSILEMPCVWRVLDEPTLQGRL